MTALAAVPDRQPEQPHVKAARALRLLAEACEQMMPETYTPDQLLTYAQVAELLAVDNSTARKLVKYGLTEIRVTGRGRKGCPRVRASDLKEFLNRRETKR